MLYRFNFSKSLSTTLIPHTCCICVNEHGAPERLCFSYTHLIHLDHNEQLVVLQIYFVTLSNQRGDLLDNTVPAQDVVVTQRRPDRELLGLRQLLLFNSS